MTPTELFEITNAMNRYGGSFVQALGELLRRADAVNQQRLAAAFPDYIEKYRELAQLAAARQAEDGREPARDGD